MAAVVDTSSAGVIAAAGLQERSRIGGSLTWLGTGVGAALVVLIARSGWYTPATGLGYGMGVVGALLMLVLMIYPLSKRLTALQRAIPIRYWFGLHMLCGVAGPVLILLHCTLRIGSPNAAVAFWSMVIVASSGVFGRFLYRRLHAGLYGRQRSFAEVAGTADRMLASALESMGPAPALLKELQGFAAHAEAVGRAGWRRPWSLATLGFAARACAGRCRRRIAASNVGDSVPASALETIARFLDAARDAAQFEAFERVFALWHTLHIPLVALLAVSAVVHVIAVHMF